MPTEFSVLDYMMTHEPSTPLLIFESDDEGLEALESPPSASPPPPPVSSPPPPPVSPPPPYEEDPYDCDQMAMRLADFYEDLRAEPNYWIRIRVIFYSPRESLLHLCQACRDEFVFSFDVYLYYDYVSYHKDCFRPGYFCSFCNAKLYQKMR